MYIFLEPIWNYNIQGGNVCEFRHPLQIHTTAFTNSNEFSTGMAFKIHFRPSAFLRRHMKIWIAYATGMDHFKTQNTIPTIPWSRTEWKQFRIQLVQLSNYPAGTTKKTWFYIVTYSPVWLHVINKNAGIWLLFMQLIRKLYFVSIELPLDRRSSCKKNSKVHTKIHDPPESQVDYIDNL